MPEREEKLLKIKDTMLQLYCFTSSEIAGYLQAVQEFPSQGLDAFMEILNSGKQQQNVLIAERIEGNKNYLQEFTQFLRDTTGQLKNQFETQEKDEAEGLLGDL